MAEHTLLKETSARIDVDQTRLLLEEHFPLAEMSLLFLGNVNKIDFRIRGQAAVCSVQAHRSSVSSMDVFENVDIESLQGSGKSYKSTWRIGRQNIDEAPEGMQKPGRGANKVTECGLAACVNSNGLQNTQQRVFCTLPTPLPSGLPVSVHASFAITGDRKTIPFENFEKETPVKKWNRWLLQECIPNLYIEFLKDLAPRIGKRCFDFWPSATMSGPDQSVEKLVQDAFWALLARSEYGSYQLYPLVDSLQSSERSTPLKTRAGGNARKLIKVASLKSAQFDVLPETVSKKLRPLFSKLCSSLVRPSPDLWRNMSEVKMHHQATTLDAAYLCNLFKDERNCALLDDYLQSFGNNSEWDTAIGMLLGIVIGNTSVGSKHPIDAVNACRIIPMVDQTLGTVRFRSKGTSPFPPDDLMFLPTEIEAELFRDRASSLIKPTLFRQPATKTLALNESVAALAAKIEAPRNPILDLMTEFSNVRDIGVQDIHHFLAHVDSSSAPAGTVDARWIVQFWSYLDQRIPVFLSEEGSELKSASVQSLLQHLKLLDTRVYRYHDEGSWSYITPEQFELGPYVLNPWGEKKEIELCRSLLGLRLVDPGCVPSQLRRNEPRLKTPHAFSRLLRALARISTRPDGSKGDVKFKMNVKEGSYSVCPL